MTDKFQPIPLPYLLKLVLGEVRQNKLFGIEGESFYRPQKGDPFGMIRYGQYLETPLGVAAGPHTQLALNIVAAWLCGARYIELKTIQTLDELEVSKPCIDMQDEGYNCEWSQELKIRESFGEYLNAWIVVHILRKELGFGGPVGTLFNMSAGYNLEGILQENVQWFLDRMMDSNVEMEAARHALMPVYPAIRDMEIPSRISDHITLSTMHGCPPEEIGRIGLYLIRERKLHTTIKLNPTLLGAEQLRTILNTHLGFSTVVPDLAFDHDLKYPDALELIRTLSGAATTAGVHFGIKLTNTLESINHKDIFPPSEKMMYMSGRALHPVSVALAAKLQEDFGGALDISFSAGADCFNVADLLACGLRPVTVCTDLLKPGGYGRLQQYVENLHHAFSQHRASSIEDYICKVAGDFSDPVQAALHNLEQYARHVLTGKAYFKEGLHEPSIKTKRNLGWFDCIHAPCTDTCPAGQEIPEYMRHTAAGNFEEAFSTILRTNPFPSVTGMICDHLCQHKCTRINYDESLRIRDIKRFIAENSPPSTPPQRREGEKYAAIIGAGPAGLSCAWFLRHSGYEVDVFEAKKLAGGMISAAIPEFRLTEEAIAKDIQRILASGIRLVEDHRIDRRRFEELQRDYDVIFLAAGAQQSVSLRIPGMEAVGVLDPLGFLYAVRQHKRTGLGQQVLVIGGGNTAMDAARTAFRLVGEGGSVTVVYRRTLREMPADQGEIDAVRREGIQIMELANPEEVLIQDGKVRGLRCTRNELSGRDTGGRPAPARIPGSDFELVCDTVIPAIGQALAIDFLDAEDLITLPGSYRTRIPKLYIGGDAMRGASTAINAIGDGLKAAREMNPPPTPSLIWSGSGGGGINRSRREYGIHPHETDLSDRRNFNLVTATFTREEAIQEASRCISCDLICNVCVSVCPNLANFSYEIEPVDWKLQKAVKMDDGTIAFRDDVRFTVLQFHQVLNIRDLCNECGNCTTFCPTSGRPFADKPGLSLSMESFKKEAEGFFFSPLPGRPTLIYKEKENFRTLAHVNGYYEYETNQVRAKIDPSTFELVEVSFLTPCVKEFRFSCAAEMAIVMKGAFAVTRHASRVTKN